MTILHVAAVLCGCGYLMRVRWDPVAIQYLVELVDCDETTKVLSATHVANEEELLTWLSEQADTMETKRPGLRGVPRT